MNRIVVGYDGSDGGRDALALSRRLVRVDAAELLVACVWIQDPVFGEVTANERERSEWFAARLEEAKAELGDVGFRSVELAHSSAPAALGQLVEIEQADLIVLGSTHRGRLGRVMPGSVGERFLHGARCAVAIAPRGYAQGEHGGLGLVGVGYDGGEESKSALRFAEEIASRLAADLRPITVLPEGQVASEWATVAGQVFRRGDPVATLAQEGVELDLLVVGSRAFGMARAALLGEVSHELMRTAPCPVIIVPRSSDTRATPRPSAAAGR